MGLGLYSEESMAANILSTLCGWSCVQPSNLESKGSGKNLWVVHKPMVYNWSTSNNMVYKTITISTVHKTLSKLLGIHTAFTLSSIHIIMMHMLIFIYFNIVLALVLTIAPVAVLLLACLICIYTLELRHYSDVIMSLMVCQIASPTILYSTVYPRHR